MILPRYNEPCHNCKWRIESNGVTTDWACTYPGSCISQDGYKTAYEPKNT